MPAGAAAPITSRRSRRKIDNGNHLLLSGNHAALDYLRRIGAETMLAGPARAEFDFADLKSGRALAASAQ